MHHKNFFMVPNRIFNLELKPRDFTVYCCLLRHCDSESTLHYAFRLPEQEGIPAIEVLAQPTAKAA